MNSGTLCWDCARAYGTCSWSRKLEPVKGWEAAETIIRARTQYGNNPITSYCVTYCPEFVRDAVQKGLVRYEEIAV